LHRTIAFASVAALLLAGCSLAPQRSSSTPPPGVVDNGGAVVTTIDPLEAFLNEAATQTAEAGSGTGGGANPELEDAFLTAQAEGSNEGVAEGEVATATPTPEVEPTNTPIPEPDVPSSYTLKKGEHPFCLARRFNINAADLLSANGYTINTSVFSVGTTLTIPQNAGTFVGERALLNHPTDYTVAAGDTLYSIACKYGDVYPEQIANANNIGVNAEPSSGTVLHIP
jgi:LysM repeat protein